MSINTNTWVISPLAIFIRLAFLLILGFSIVAWIDSEFPTINIDKSKGSMVHHTLVKTLVKQDSVWTEKR